MEEHKVIIEDMGDERIGFNKNNGKFYAEEKVGDGWGELKSDFYNYDDAEKYLVSRKKRKSIIKKKSFEPLYGMGSSGWSNDFGALKITSLADKSYSTQYVWVVNSKGIHSKKDVESILKDNEDNKSYLKKIAELEEEIKNTKALIQKFTDEEVIKHFGGEEDETN